MISGGEPLQRGGRTQTRQETWIGFGGGKAPRTEEGRGLDEYKLCLLDGTAESVTLQGSSKRSWAVDVVRVQRED